VLAVCWYLRYGLSYRDVEELLAERGITVDHVTVYRWAQRCTPLLAEAATGIGTGSVTDGGSTTATSKCLTGLRPSPTRHVVAGLGGRAPVGGI
jgi:hypothetical protein